MNQQLTDTFHDVAEHLDVPPIDHLAFQRKVRAARGRKGLRTGSVVAAAACAVAVAAYAVPGMVSDGSTEGSVATPPEAVPSAAAIPLILDGHLSILRSNGAVVGMVEKPLEAVGPWGEDGALAIGADGTLTAYTLRGEYRQVDAPTEAKVQAARTSNDGNSVAWIDNGQLTLASDGRTQWSFPVTPNASLFDVQAAAALYWDEGGLHVRTGDSAVPLPTDGMPDWAMIARDIVQVAYEDRSVFYQLRGTKQPIERSGVEIISPDAELTFGVDGIVRTLDGQERGPVTGLPGPLAKAVWFDHDTILVSTGPESGATKASVCDVTTLSCETIRLDYKSVELPTSP